MQIQSSFKPISAIMGEIIDDIKGGKLCPCALRTDRRGESELEWMFWHMMLKTNGSWHGAADQLQIGRYRVDAIIDCDGKAVVVELDGKQFHDRERDAIRDAEILKSVDAIIRIPFASLWHYRYGTFRILAEWFPRFALPGYGPTFTVDEFEAERNIVCEDPEASESMWLEDAEHSYDLITIGRNASLVGSPKALQLGWKIAPIIVRTGRRSPGMIERIYEKAGCGRHLTRGSK